MEFDASETFVRLMIELYDNHPDPYSKELAHFVDLLEHCKEVGSTLHVNC